MSGGGSSTTTSSSTVPQTFLNAYNSTVNRASSVANTPYQAYTGNLVAGFSPDQTTAQGEVEQAQGAYQPELSAANSAVGASTAPLWSNTQQFSPSTIAQYESPYQSQVVGATEAQINNTDAQQMAQLGGNAASAGAFGGDRMGVAQGILGGQQAIANNSTLANLNNQNYTQALGEFNNQQQAQLSANEANAWLNSQAGYAYGNLAQEGNNLALGDASALASSGLTQQQQAQAGLNTAYEQWQAQQAFPYQQTGWLANITEGIGSNVGGSSTTTQTNNAAGGRVPRAAGGIVVPGYDNGGGILSEIPDVATSYIPTSGSGGSGGGGIGRGPPAPPSAQVQPGMSPATMIGAAGGATSLYNNLGGPQLIGTNGIISGPLFGSGSGAPSIIGNGGMGIASDGESVPLTNMGSSAFGPGLDTLSMPSPATVGAYNPSLFGSLFGSGSAAASVPSTEIASSAIPTGIGSGALDSTIPTLTADAASGAGAGGAGFLGSLGSAVDAGAGAVGDALASGAGAIASGVGALGDAAATAGTAVAGGLSDAMAWLLPLLCLKDGGAVPAQPRASGGIVVPFPQREARAHGGIVGNNGEMPYSMAPPVLATGTTGMPVMGIFGTSSQPGPANLSPSGGALADGGTVARAFGGGMGSGRGNSVPATGFGSFAAPSYTVSGTPGAGNTNPMGILSPSGYGSAASMGAHPFGLKTGGIVVPFRRHFDDGGSTDPQPTDAMVDQLRADETSGAQSDAAAAAAPATGAAPQSSASASSTPSGGATQTYQPEKPNLWIPALAGLATAALGRHHEVGHNIAEGVLAGLGTYSKEDEQYQGQQEKAATIQQEAKRLADAAEQHRADLAETVRSHMATEGTAAQNAASEATFRAASGRADLENANSNAVRAAADVSSAVAMQNLRDVEAARGDWFNAGTTADGKYSVMINHFTGEQKPVPLINPTVAQQGRIDNASDANEIRRDALVQRATLAAAAQTAAEKRAVASATDVDLGIAKSLMVSNAQIGKTLSVGDAVAQAQQMRSLMAGSAGQPTQPTAGAAPQPQPQQPTYQEGMTATNPSTGAKLVFRGGQWTLQ